MLRHYKLRVGVVLVLVQLSLASTLSLASKIGAQLSLEYETETQQNVAVSGGQEQVNKARVTTTKKSANGECGSIKCLPPRRETYPRALAILKKHMFPKGLPAGRPLGAATKPVFCCTISRNVSSVATQNRVRRNLFFIDMFPYPFY